MCIIHWLCNHHPFWGVSSVSFPFWFPFQLHCKLVSSGINSQLVQNILIWSVTLKERPILVLSLLRFSEMTYELITELGTRTGYLREVQMKPTLVSWNLIKIPWCNLLSSIFLFIQHSDLRLLFWACKQHDKTQELLPRARQSALRSLK